MPLPKPKPNEKQAEFISRFMSSEAMKKEFPDNKQRQAVAFETFRRGKKTNDSDISGDVSVVDKAELTKDKFSITPEGYLKVHVNFTRPGIFVYYQDGKPIRRLRPDNEVFDPASFSTLALQPVTDLHPDEEVTADNIRTHHRGVVGETIKKQNGFVSGYAVIQDKQLIDEIMAKHEAGESSEVSCGYLTDIIRESGVHPIYGEYDEIQTKIRYNHVAVVDRGRMGPEAKLLLDKKQKHEEETNMSLIKILVDAVKTKSFSMDSIGVEVPVENKGAVETVISKLKDAATVIVTLETDAQKAQAQMDQDKEKIVKLEKDVAELSDPASGKFSALVEAAKTMASVADFLGVPTKDESGAPKSRTALRNAIIAATCNDSNFDATGKDEVYLNARFDIVAEDWKSEKLQRKKEEDGIKKLAEDAATQKADDKDDPVGDFSKAVKDMAALPSERE